MSQLDTELLVVGLSVERGAARALEREGDASDQASEPPVSDGSGSPLPSPDGLVDHTAPWAEPAVRWRRTDGSRSGAKTPTRASRPAWRGRDSTSNATDPAGAAGATPSTWPVGELPAAEPGKRGGRLNRPPKKLRSALPIATLRERPLQHGRPAGRGSTGSDPGASLGMGLWSHVPGSDRGANKERTR